MDIEYIIKTMSLKEKIALCSGKNEWHTKDYSRYEVPSVMMSDGPNGLRKQSGPGDILGIQWSEEATCFPLESIVACSFDKDLLGEMGAAIAEETGAAGVSMFLGPGVNIKRNPLCGRNFEYFSEDPFLSGRLGAAYISGAQKKGIGTSLKHYACNNQEYYRLASDSIIDERTLREIYLTAFEYAVKKGKPLSVMCSYNKLNGVYCSDNKYLLTDILRDEWGFEGLVVTDWGAINDRSKSFEAGCDLVMPGGNAYGEKSAWNDVKKGVLSEKHIDQSAKRILDFVEKTSDVLETVKFDVDYDKHHELARRIAEESAVLLKNEGDLLPCELGEIVLIGQMAENYRYQGHGSSRINPTRVDNLLAQLPEVPYVPGYDEEGNTSDELLAEALALARSAKKVVVVAGLPDIAEAEGIDRTDMRMPSGQNRIIAEIGRINPNVIVVLCCGCAVETPWADDVKSILYMGLAGQAGARALVNLLTGKANPCGRLAETWPLTYEDCPSASYYINGRRNGEYREGIYLGYRYYEKAGKPVRFPFGTGLSYTTFSYHSLRIEENRVYIRVTNTGDCYGGEVVLMYIRGPQDGIHRPIREMKGFEKVFLFAGESREICFVLEERDFAVWYGGWKVYGGEFIIQIGDCKVPLQIDGLTYNGQMDQCWYHTLKGDFEGKDWLKALGRPLDQESTGLYTVNSTVGEIAEDSLIIRIMFRQFEKMQAKASGRGTVKYQMAMMGAKESPLRNVQNSFMIRGNFAQAIADFGNKRYLRGLWSLIF